MNSYISLDSPRKILWQQNHEHSFIGKGIYFAAPWPWNCLVHSMIFAESVGFSGNVPLRVRLWTPNVCKKRYVFFFSFSIFLPRCASNWTNIPLLNTGVPQRVPFFVDLCQQGLEFGAKYFAPRDLMLGRGYSFHVCLSPQDHHNG